ncbi:hypothetical protein VTP01DRAFT_2105 [Rhizomucor pusillus]|uniref:uncharacterized protein n=1 Tax=Rhizomucor pusillus TaxID=4840 RepID=UPI0037420A5B
MSTPKFENLEITVFPNGVTEIAFNRPEVYNALSGELYKDWLDAIVWAKSAEQVKVVVLTGRGKYYSSGAKLQAPDTSPAGVAKEKERKTTVKTLVAELIKFPKLLIAAVNGPAFGFAVTTLALCDAVYSVPSATFATPFMKLAFCAEGCSSVLFPRIMGPSRASEMLLMGRTFIAQELEQCGLVGRILPAEGFLKAVLAIAEDAAKFSPAAIATTKELVRRVDRDLLLQVNEEEMARLEERRASKESRESIMNFVHEAERKREAKRRAKNQPSATAAAKSKL